MDWKLSRTGVDGEVVEPYTASCGIVGVREDDSAAVLGFDPLWLKARDCLHRIRDRHNEMGWRPTDWWQLARYTAGGQKQVADYTDCSLDEQWWDETRQAMGIDFDKAQLLGPYSLCKVTWESPVRGLYSRRCDAVLADVVSPAGSLTEDCVDWLDVLADAAGVDGVHAGYVHADSIADPYTRIVTEDSGLSDGDFRRRVHGYYWALLLTEGHLNRLGGRTTVLSQAPCQIVKDVGGGAREAVLCVLTKSPHDIDPDTVLRWRDYLQPVLRPGYPMGLENVGLSYALAAPLARPVWLFEGAPAPGSPGNTMGALMLNSLADLPRSVPLDWVDADPATSSFSSIRIELGPGFVDEQYLGVLETVVRAWEMTVKMGGLPEVPEIQVRGVEEFSVDMKARYVDIRLADPVPAVAIERLAAAISGLADFVGKDDPVSVLRRLVVAR